MLIDRIAQRYARSVYSLAAEKGQVELFLREFRAVKATVEASHDLRRFLGNPILTAERKVAILKKVFEGKVEPVTLTLIVSLARRHRAEVLPYIAREFIAIYQAQHNIKALTVRTATTLTPAQRDLITQRVNSTLKATSEFTEVIDRDLIGGVVIEVDGKRYDSSIATQISHLRKQFKDNPYIEIL